MLRIAQNRSELRFGACKCYSQVLLLGVTLIGYKLLGIAIPTFAVRSQTGPYGPVQLSLGPDRTAVPECRTVQSGLFIGLHLSLRPDCSFPRPDCIFRSGLRSQLARPYSPVFFNGLQIRPRSGPDRTVASLFHILSAVMWYFSIASSSCSKKKCQRSSE